MANLESKIKALTDNRKHIAEADPAVYKEVTGRNLEEDLKDIDTAASGFKKLKAGFEKEKTQMSDNEYKKFEAADEVRKRNTDVMKETKLDNKFEKVELKLEAIEPDPADPEFEKYEDYKRRYDEIKLELESQAKNDTEGSTEAPGLHEKIRKLADDIQKDINHDLKLKNKLKIPKKRSVKTTKGKSSEKVESDMEVCKR